MKPKQCPKCESEKVLPILYGLVSGPVPDVILGGCCVTGADPEWHCENCHWEWGGHSAGGYKETGREPAIPIRTSEGRSGPAIQREELGRLIEEAREGGDLTPRQLKILDMRYGLTDGKTHTLAEVGLVFCISRERVRQIVAKALEKIRQ